MRTRHFVIAAVLAATTAYPWVASAGKFSMADLKALVEQESWTEVLEHLADISPAKRDKSWQTYLEKAATGFLRSVDASGSGSGYQAIFTAEDFIVRYPTLKKSKSYMEQRAEVGLKAFDECFRYPQQSVQCVEQLEKFVAVDPTNDDLAFRAGQKARLGAGFRPAARLFEIAFQRKSRRVGCADEQVKLAITQTLANTTHAPTLASARKVAFDYCWPALKDALLEEFMGADSAYLKETCPDLKKKKALTPFQTALCQDTLASK